MCVCAVQLVVTPPVISSNTFVTVLRMMSTLCVACPVLAVELLKISKSGANPLVSPPFTPSSSSSSSSSSPSDTADTLRYLLAGSGEITLENIEVRALHTSTTTRPTHTAECHNPVPRVYTTPHPPPHTHTHTHTHCESHHTTLQYTPHHGVQRSHMLMSIIHTSPCVTFVLKNA